MGDSLNRKSENYVLQLLAPSENTTLRKEDQKMESESWSSPAG